MIEGIKRTSNRDVSGHTDTIAMLQLYKEYLDKAEERNPLLDMRTRPTLAGDYGFRNGEPMTPYTIAEKLRAVDNFDFAIRVPSLSGISKDSIQRQEFDIACLTELEALFREQARTWDRYITSEPKDKKQEDFGSKYTDPTRQALISIIQRMRTILQVLPKQNWPPQPMTRPLQGFEAADTVTLAATLQKVERDLEYVWFDAAEGGTTKSQRYVGLRNTMATYMEIMDGNSTPPYTTYASESVRTTRDKLIIQYIGLIEGVSPASTPSYIVQKDSVLQAELTSAWIWYTVCEAQQKIAAVWNDLAGMLLVYEKTWLLLATLRDSELELLFNPSAATQDTKEWLTIVRTLMVDEESTRDVPIDIDQGTRIVKNTQVKLDDFWDLVQRNRTLVIVLRTMWTRTYNIVRDTTLRFPTDKELSARVGNAFNDPEGVFVSLLRAWATYIKHPLPLDQLDASMAAAAMITDALKGSNKRERSNLRTETLAAMYNAAFPRHGFDIRLCMSEASHDSQTLSELYRRANVPRY